MKLSFFFIGFCFIAIPYYQDSALKDSTRTRPVKDSLTMKKILDSSKARLDTGKAIVNAGYKQIDSLINKYKKSKQ